MRVTKKQLRRIIRESIQAEQNIDEGILSDLGDWAKKTFGLADKDLKDVGTVADETDALKAALNKYMISMVKAAVENDKGPDAAKDGAVKRAKDNLSQMIDMWAKEA